MDLITFLNSLDICLATTIVSIPPQSVKRPKTDPALFDGLSCFFSSFSHKACALTALDSSDPYSLRTVIEVPQRNHLVIQFQRADQFIACRFDHSAVRLIRVARPVGASKRPSWLGLDFGCAEIRLWRQDGQDFAHALLQSMCPRLGVIRPPPRSRLLDAERIFAQLARAKQDRSALKDALTKVVELLKGDPLEPF